MASSGTFNVPDDAYLLMSAKCYTLKLKKIYIIVFCQKPSADFQFHARFIFLYFYVVELQEAEIS